MTSHATYSSSAPAEQRCHARSRYRKKKRALPGYRKPSVAVTLRSPIRIVNDCRRMAAPRCEKL